MREKNVKEIVRYYYEIPEMVRLLKTEQREQESLYDTLKGTGGDGMPGGGGPGKPVETAVIRLDERGVYERLQEIHVRLLVLEGDAAAVRGCLDGLSGKYKSILQLRHKCHHSWANISVRMGAPDSTVRSWHDKAVLCLGEALDEVPMAEASRFGILNTNEDGSIYEFDEKPKKPKSNKASMGIYVFTWEKLRKYLEQDEEDPKSQNDFGKNVLPAMLNAGEAMYAYRFEGYWKDVGTIDSLWESNMDLLDPNVPLELNDPEWRIYSRNPVMPPHYVAKGATIQNSLAAEGCNVYGTVDFSVLFAGVYVAPGATVRDSIIMPGARIEEGATVQYAIVAEDSVVGANSVVGQRPEDVENKEDWGVAVIGPGCKLAPGTVVPPKAMIDAEEVEK